MFGVSTSGCKMNKFNMACNVSALNMRETTEENVYT